MTNEKRAVVIGVFRDRALAERAVADLKEAGWQSDQISIAERGSPGVLATLKQVLTEGTAARTDEAAELDNIALPEEQHQFYQRELEAGSYLVLVEPKERPLEARELLHRYGAYHVFIPLEVGGERTIPVRQESVEVRKEFVEVGEIRIHKRIITEDRTFTIPVTREEVTIERIPYQPPASPPEMRVVSNETRSKQFGQGTQPTLAPEQVAREGDITEALKEGGTIHILVHEEQVLLQKQPVVVEEIVLQKQVIEETKQIVEPVKREEVRLEQVGQFPVHERIVGVHGQKKRCFIRFYLICKGQF